MSGHVVVTGAATGIGAAVTERLLADGTHVIGLGLDGQEGRAQQSRAERDGLPYAFHDVDVTDEAAVRGVFSRITRLTGVVNCAGVYPRPQRLEDVSLADFRAVMNVNLTGTFLVCRAALPLLRASGGGSIVNLASVHARSGAPGQGPYAASKAAIVGLTRQIAVDYAQDRIRANAVLAGSVDTRITREAIAAAGSPEALGLSYARTALGRIAESHEVAAVVAFLLGPDASFITAAEMVADAGLTARIL